MKFLFKKNKTEDTSKLLMPEHYKKASTTVEPIVLCKQFSFVFGNFIKYVLRAPYKDNPLEDYKKALTYLTWIEDDVQSIFEPMKRNKDLALSFNNEYLNILFRNLDNYFWLNKGIDEVKLLLKSKIEDLESNLTKLN